MNIQATTRNGDKFNDSRFLGLSPTHKLIVMGPTLLYNIIKCGSGFFEH